MGSLIWNRLRAVIHGRRLGVLLAVVAVATMTGVESSVAVLEPETTISSGPSGTTGPGGTTNSTSASFSFSSSQAGSTFACRLDSGSWASCSSPKAYSGLADGSHTFEVRASNAAGLTDPTPATRTWQIDTVPPDTEITAGPTGELTSSNFTFEFSSPDAGASFECKLDAGAWAACSSPKVYENVANGAHTFSVRARDLGGNRDPSPATRSFTLSAPPPSAPSFDATRPESPANSTSPKIGGSAAAGSTVRLYLTADCSGSPVATGSAASFESDALSVPVESGKTVRVRATATDGAGNTSACSAGSISYSHDPVVNEGRNVLLDSSLTVQGAVSDDQAGYSLASVGDVNNDGLDDLAVGAPSATALGRQWAGVVYVVFGRTDKKTLDLKNFGPADGFRIFGADVTSWTGSAIAGLGDVNGDGNADLAVGAPDADPGGRTNAGSVYVVLGGPVADLDLATVDLGLAGTRAYRIDGEAAWDGLGRALGDIGIGAGGLISAGDINGDGLDDVVLGAAGADEGGAVYVVHGSRTPVSIDLAGGLGSSGFKITGESGGGLGFSLGRVPDTNGDGLADVVVGQQWDGKAYVVFGKADTGNVDVLNLGTGGYRLDGVGRMTVATGGDINGDNRSDVVVSAVANPTTHSNGTAYAVFGRTETSPIALANIGTAGFPISGAPPDSAFGRAVAGAGDLNGDALADIIVGAPHAEADGGPLVPGEGAAWVVFGKESDSAINVSALARADGFKIGGSLGDDRQGSTVAGAGDVTGDGVRDVVVGAYYASPNLRSHSGSAYVIPGGLQDAALARPGFRACPATSSLETDFAAYQLGSSFDGLANSDTFRRCEPRVNEPGRANFLSYIYGDCAVPEGQEHGCSLPLEVQNWPACERNRASYRLGPVDEPYPRVDDTVRGVPAAWFDESTRLELYTGETTVVLFGESATQLRSAADALTSSTVGANTNLPAPAAGALSGQLAC